MANNCWNSIEITGSKEAIDTIEKKFKEYDNFNYFTQFAQNFYREVEDVPEEGKFDWCYKYGTKWLDLRFGTMERQSDEVLYISADTAWGPCLPLSEAISKHYKCDVEHEFSESGMGFAGRYAWQDGECVREDTVDYTVFEYQEWGYDYLEREAEHYLEDTEYDTFEEFWSDAFQGELDNVVLKSHKSKIKKMYEKSKLETNGSI